MLYKFDIGPNLIETVVNGNITVCTDNIFQQTIEIKLIYEQAFSILFIVTSSNQSKSKLVRIRIGPVYIAVTVNPV